MKYFTRPITPAYDQSGGNDEIQYEQEKITKSKPTLGCLDMTESRDTYTYIYIYMYVSLLKMIQDILSEYGFR